MANRLQQSDTFALPDEAMSPLSRVRPTRPRSADPRFSPRDHAVNGGLPQADIGITDGIVQFDGEREMWASYQDSDLRAKRRLRAIIAGGALLVR